jgi:hypothetical protein
MIEAKEVNLEFERMYNLEVSQRNSSDNEDKLLVKFVFDLFKNMFIRHFVRRGYTQKHCKMQILRNKKLDYLDYVTREELLRVFVKLNKLRLDRLRLIRYIKPIDLIN